MPDITDTGMEQGDLVTLLTNIKTMVNSIRTQLAAILDGSSTWDPGSLGDGAGETKSITVTGAALGDFVMVSAPYDMEDVTVSGYVQAANTVEIRVQNESTSTVDLGSGTWRVKVIPPTSLAALSESALSLTGL